MPCLIDCNHKILKANVEKYLLICLKLKEEVCMRRIYSKFTKIAEITYE